MSLKLDEVDEVDRMTACDSRRLDLQSRTRIGFSSNSKVILKFILKLKLKRILKLTPAVKCPFRILQSSSSDDTIGGA